MMNPDDPGNIYTEYPTPQAMDEEQRKVEALIKTEDTDETTE